MPRGQFQSTIYEGKYKTWDNNVTKSKHRKFEFFGKDIFGIKKLDGGLGRGYDESRGTDGNLPQVQ